MATSFVQGTFTGSSSQINVTFGYLDKTHVYVYLNGVLKTVGVDYVWNSDAQIQILGGNPAAGTVYLAQRRTPNELMTTYAPGNLDSTDLNFSFLQAIYIANEAQDAISQKWNTLEGVTGRTIQAVGTTSGNILVYDASGNLIDSGTNISSLASVPANAALALQYRNEAQGFRNEASNYAVSSSGYATQSLGYRDQSQGYSLVAQQYATSMSLINGTDYSAKYWANQAHLAGGVPVGAKVSLYGNGTTTPVGYIKWIPGLEVTAAYPQLRAYGLANGWAVNGNGNPVLPSGDSLFERMWLPSQTQDAGRVFGTVQADAFQGHTHTSGVGGGTGLANGVNFGTGPYGAAATDGVNGVPRTASETRPVNLTFTWYIKAYDAITDAATINAAQVLADLADARARVASLEAKAEWELIEEVTLSAVASYIKTGLSAFRELRFEGTLIPSATQTIGIQTSNDNGGSWTSTADYSASANGVLSGASSVGAGSTYAQFPLSWNNLLAGQPFTTEGLITQFNKAGRTQVVASISGYNSASAFFDQHFHGIESTANGLAHNAIRFLPNTGTISGTFRLLGRRG